IADRYKSNTEGTLRSKLKCRSENYHENRITGINITTRMERAMTEVYLRDHIKNEDLRQTTVATEVIKYIAKIKCNSVGYIECRMIGGRKDESSRDHSPTNLDTLD
ncbi:MAG: hypothetical protein KTM48_01590, partial [Wolbachia endosymbiont of Pissodes strobi]|nr:hypothetical protein [Wolbachia endosymbiont of Pissodes strobi]